MRVKNFTPEKRRMLQPVSFAAKVLDVELTATIIEIADHPVQNEFVIKFSDGYVDTFTMSEEGTVTPANWLSGKHYAAAITTDMQVLGLLSSDDVVWCTRHSLNDAFTNVWITRKKYDTSVQYSVYYNGDYYFHIKQENGEWISETSRKIDPQPINAALSEEVIKLVAKEHLVIPFEMV